MHDWLIALILGIVEGITEFLPVSSTGHLLIAEKFLHSHQSDLFNVVIQCGAVIAVLPLFPQRIYKFVFEWREPETKSYLLKLFTAFAITGVFGLVLKHYGLKLDDQKPANIAWALLIAGSLSLSLSGGCVDASLQMKLRGPLRLLLASRS